MELYEKLVESMSGVADELFEDSAGEDSIICQLQRESPRFDVVKLPYFLSQTAVYKRFFVWGVARKLGKDPWEFLLECSSKRFAIIMTPRRAALWHLGVAREMSTV